MPQVRPHRDGRRRLDQLRCLPHARFQIMTNLARELSVLADLSDEDLAILWKFMLDRLAWLEYERARREGNTAWRCSSIDLNNPVKEHFRKVIK